MYKGDALLIYFGFNGTVYREYLDKDDYEINFGFHENGMKLYIKKNFIPVEVKKNPEVSFKENKNGYIFEAKIPLANFDNRVVGFNEKLLIDFSLVNVNKNKNIISCIYSGKKNTWALPKYWEPILLQNDENIFRKPYVMIQKKELY